MLVQLAFVVEGANDFSANTVTLGAITVVDLVDVIVVAGGGVVASTVIVVDSHGVLTGAVETGGGVVDLIFVRV